MCLSDDEIKTVVEYDEEAKQYVNQKPNYIQLLGHIDEYNAMYDAIRRDRRQHEIILFNMLPDEKYWGEERIKGQRDAIREYNIKMADVKSKLNALHKQVSEILGVDIA